MSILQKLPGGMQFPWEIGKKNRAKNRYGNIVSCEYISFLLHNWKITQSKYARADCFKTLFLLNNQIMSSRFLSRVRPQLSRIAIESEQFNCFSSNLLVVQSFILILLINTAKHQEAAVILLTRAHRYATHYLSQTRQWVTQPFRARHL